MDNVGFMEVIHHEQEALRALCIYLDKKCALFEMAGLSKASEVIDRASRQVHDSMKTINDAEGQWVSDVLKESWVASDESLRAALSSVSPGGELDTIQKKLEEGRSAAAWMWNQARSIDKNLPDDATVSDCARIISSVIRVGGGNE